ncbi:tungsten formylmethanofuran dehydrogenase [Deminuibacter soli]|uniref:3-methyl-2-oxobutanoate dehydrogenase (2-methylpropanoyl-transferring) n=2 Tax=Deminuibacter soli TaxID=2291815 RepID=A0A3E1NDN4_9BACT|nr:tungsten formylmethanofuran dehydrogenase [Deminuibacter soli]
MLSTNELARAFGLMATARAMAMLYEQERNACRYVHAVATGHEAIQIAAGSLLESCDYVSPYYRDDAMLLSMGFEPHELMLQLLAKADDPFSGGRSYYCHPSSTDNTKPRIIHQSSATGMQAIPSTGIAQGIQYLNQVNAAALRRGENGEFPVVLCSFGDNSITEGEVSEALQFAVLKKLPIIYLVQDNQWGISVSAEEARAMNAWEYAAGFKGLHRLQADGTDLLSSFAVMEEAFRYARSQRGPVLVHASVVLLAHHTSGVRREFYRSKENLEAHAKNDPYPKLRRLLLQDGFTQDNIEQLEREAVKQVYSDFRQAQAAADPAPATVADHVFAPTPITEEQGTRMPVGGEKTIMVDAALHAIEEIMQQHPECLLYGQDVGRTLGGVFREAATLAEKFGDHRVFNTAIQEAYIAGSTIGMAAVGLRPIVEVQFGDYVYPAINQLASELVKSSYLSNGKFSVPMILRVPVGAYGGGGPYHSGSIESTLLSIKGLKVCFPSNAADLKGLMKAAYYDPNPVIMLEHKGLYWSKVPGTEDAKTIEPDKDYILPLGKANVVVTAAESNINKGDSVCVVTYGMGVHWAKAAAAKLYGRVEVVDLRTLYPLDEALVFDAVKRHGRCLVLTEEQQNNSFAEALAWRISHACFSWLDVPVEVMGALSLPAVPINIQLEAAMLPSAVKLIQRLQQLLDA